MLSEGGVCLVFRKAGCLKIRKLKAVLCFRKRGQAQGEDEAADSSDEETPIQFQVGQLN